MSSNFQLYYFNGRARGELIRLVFEASGTSYKDNRVDLFNEWPALKQQGIAPLNQLPFIEFNNGEKLCQSISVARFLAREFNLAGSGNLRQAQADAVVDTVMDIVNHYYPNIFLIPKPEDKEKAFNEFLDNHATKVARNIEKLIELYGSNGYAVGDSLTWADLAILDVVTSLFNRRPNFVANFPLIEANYKKCLENQNLSNYLKNRPADSIEVDILKMFA